MLPLAATCLLLLLLLGPSLGGAVKIVPKLEFEDTSPGISPDHSKTFLEKEISVNPGVVKALLEVKVGESLVTIKPDKKGDKDSKTTKILICDAWGECKLHEVVRGKEDDDDDDKDEEDEDEGGKKKLKPVIVTDFDEDPLADKDDSDDGKKKKGKKVPKIPVIIGYKGAVRDDGFPYTGPGTHYGPGVYDHDPGVYDHSPGVYDHSPGVYDHSPGVYDHSPGVYDHSPGIPDYGHGDHNYGADGYGHVGWHGYNPTTSGHGSRVDRIPVYYGMKLSPEFHQPYPGLVLDEEASRPYHGRTPTPYGKFYTTRRPGSYHAIITPLGRKTGVRWPPAVAVVGKMDLPQDELTAPTERPSVIKIDGKLGEALAKDEKEQ